MDWFSEVLSFTSELLCIFLCFLTEILNNIRWWFFPVYKDLKDDVVLITGGGNGIGRLMCLEFSKYCSKVVAWDCDEGALKETADLVLKQSGHVLHTYVCDLRYRDQIRQVANQVLKDVGSVTVLVNNAGIVSAKRLLDLSPEDVENTFKVNALAHFHTIQAFLPFMLSAGRLTVESACPSGDQITPSNVNVPRGHIVNITSVAGNIPGVGLSDYCASKAASLRMSECLELELRQMGLQNSIHVTNVLPFLMDTRLFRGSQPLRQWLFPIVSSEYCARRVVQAVRLNERTVYVTARYRVLSIIKCLAPTETLHLLYDMGGSEKLTDQLQAERHQAKSHEE